MSVAAPLSSTSVEEGEITGILTAVLTGAVLADSALKNGTLLSEGALDGTLGLGVPVPPGTVKSKRHSTLLETTSQLAIQ